MKNQKRETTETVAGSFDPFSDFRMEGHIALVTGGAQNIGEAIAKTFSGAGAKVMIADLNGQKAQYALAHPNNLTGRAGSPQDVANAFLWLASPAGSWVSGKTFTAFGLLLIIAIFWQRVLGTIYTTPLLGTVIIAIAAGMVVFYIGVAVSKELLRPAK